MPKFLMDDIDGFDAETYEHMFPDLDSDYDDTDTPEDDDFYSAEWDDTEWDIDLLEDVFGE